MSKETTGSPNNEMVQPAPGRPTGANKDEGLGFQATEDQNFNTDRDEDAPTRDGEAFAAAELPQILSREQFLELADFKSVHCISIYLCTHEAGEAVNNNQDLINFKNQLQEAQRRLRESGFHNEREIKQLLEPGFGLSARMDFWKDQAPGLAVFIAENFFRFVRMHQPPKEELLMIESSFYVTPLVPLLAGDDTFFVLVISKQCAKLFRGNSLGLRHVPLDLPQSIQEVKRLSDLDATTFRSGSNGSRGPRYSQEGVYHGAAGGNPDDKDNMQVYFQAVDDMIWKNVLHDQHAPLIIAAVEYEIPIYRSICNYGHVWPEGLTGNRDSQDAGSLFEEARVLLEPYFKERTEKALQLYMNNSANGNTSSVLADVIPAAYYRRISHLFVARGVHIWGTFDEMTSELQLHETQTEDSEDLLDNAVEKTLANGGEVFLLEEDRMPAQSPVAALMRF